MMMEEGDVMDDSSSEHNTDQSPLRGSGDKQSDYSKGSMAAYDGIVKRGILSKRGRKKIFRPWVLRTVVLDDRNMLSYYDGHTLKGTIRLDGTITSLVPPERADNRNFAFEISNIQSRSTFQTDSLLLAASSQLEAESWVEAITSLNKKHVSTKGNFQYESFETLTRNVSATQPLNVKKLKQNLKKNAEEEDDEIEITSDDD